MNIKNCLILLMSFIFLISCSEENSTGPISLIADAGPTQQVDPLDLVSLDGTGSVGPEGFTYLWSYSGDVPESEINFENITSAQPTFIPPTNDIYTFTLKVSSGGSSDEDQVVVVTEGPVKIGGTLTEDLILTNIQPDASLPDYLVTGDLIIENGIKLSIIEKDVRIMFEEGVGIQIQTDGLFSNLDESNSVGYECDLYGNAGWKGILLKDGIIELNNAEIENAGNSTFFGFDEAAALLIAERNSSINEFSNNNFVNSHSYDILVLTNPINSDNLKNNRLSSAIPIKAPITFMDYWHSGEPFIFPAEYDYLHLIPGGADKKDEITTNFVFHEGGKYYIDGDFWAGTSVELGLNTTLYMKANSAIYSEGNFTIHTSLNNEVLIEGLNGATWKGIATASNKELKINDATIKDAGYGIINIGGVEAKVPSALYSFAPGTASNIGNIDFSEIINSGGYGYYSESTKRVSFRIRGTLFKNTALAAIRTTTVCVGPTIVATNFPNTFELAPGIPPYLVEEDGSPGDVWYSLGGNNYYLIDADLDLENGFTLAPGSVLKFKSGRALICDNPNTTLRFEALNQDPIILDGETGEPGSWGGLYLGCDFRLINTIITNGGEFILPGATEKTNIVSAVPTSLVGQFYMSYSEISNSAGYGIVIEAGTKDIEYEAPDNNNTFENNALGDIIRK